MRIWRIFVLSLVVAGGLAAIMSWPLPKYFSSGMPISNHNPADKEVQAMVPGDHLQFLYHVWLAKDSFMGETPLFCNPYEFNLGDDSDRKNIAMRYYLPFSLFFSLGTSFVNQVFGWNFMGFISLWLTWLFTWLLVRRYTENRLYAVVCACISIILPYRWFSLLGGSPTGLAMAWVPVVYYGLDVMVRDKRMWGAILAGAAICLSKWSDPHVMFFTGLTAPFWCVLSYLFHHRRSVLPSRRELWRYLRAAAPLVLFVLIAFMQVKSLAGGLEETDIAEKSRSLAEVATRSPHLGDAFLFGYDDIGNQTYIGYFTAILLVSGTCVLLFKTFKSYRQGDSSLLRPCLAGVLLFLAVVAIWLLGAGTNMPGGARAWEILTKLVPPYGKLRQSAKIFSILPVVLAVEFAVLLPHLLGSIRKKTVRNAACVGILAVMTLDFGHSAYPPICLLDEEQGAYAAVKADARSRGEEGHILVLPLWPGDSHWSSLYQYYVSLYRLRMVNGYKPTPRRDYIDYISQFESFNLGCFPDEKLDELLSTGVEYLCIHEDAFPEKVSLYSVAHTINGLLRHPRIKLLDKDKAVWSFKILDKEMGGEHPELPGSEYVFPTRVWQAETDECKNGHVLESADSSGGRYLAITNIGSTVRLPAHTFAWFPSQSYNIRIKGEGDCIAEIYSGGKLLHKRKLENLSDDWEWRKLAIPPFDGYIPISIAITPQGAMCDVDAFMLQKNGLDLSRNQRSVLLPAPIFFHAGYTDLETGEVVIEPARVPADAIFYGPNLPLPSGRYRVRLIYSTDAPSGTVLGKLVSRYSCGKGKTGEIVAGKPSVFHCTRKNNFRMAINFIYNREAPMRIKGVLISREQN